MPLTLYRYILGELVRVMLVTTAVIVTVVAFGAAVKPLSDEVLLGPEQTAKYVALAMVPMMQFALPFAAGFAATIVLHRLATDNEINAAAASGLSYRRILLPVLALGLVLGLIMVGLTQSLIPMFWRLMHRTITTDVIKLFESTLSRGRPFMLNDWQIHADQLRVMPAPQDTQAEMRFLLLGVAAAKTGPDGALVSDFTARQAVVDIHRRGARRFLKIKLYDQVGYDGQTGQMASAPEAEPLAAVPLADTFKDDGSFLSLTQLRHYRDHPDEFSDVIDAREKLAAALRQQQVWDHLDAQLQRRATLELRARGALTSGGGSGGASGGGSGGASGGGSGGGGEQGSRSYIVTADRLEHGVLLADEGRPIEVVEFDRNTAVRKFTAARAELDRSRLSTGDPRMFDLVLTDVGIEDFRLGVSNRGGQRTLAGLLLPDLPRDEFPGQDSATLLAAAQRSPTPAKPIELAAWKLNRELDELRWDITARMHQRSALSTTAVLLLVLGAVLAMWLRQSLPLVIYVWAFLPSIANLLLISGGYQLMRDGVLAGGAAVTWSGNALLAGIMIAAYLRLARN